MTGSNLSSHGIQHTTPLHGPIAIINVHPGTDGTIRVVTLKSSKDQLQKSALYHLLMLNFNFSPFGKWQYAEVQDKFMHNTVKPALNGPRIKRNLS